MAREVIGYRENLEYLTDKGLPALMTQKQVAEALGISQSHVKTLIKSGHIKTVGTLIPLGSVARVICG